MTEQEPFTKSLTPLQVLRGCLDIQSTAKTLESSQKRQTSTNVLTDKCFSKGFWEIWGIADLKMVELKSNQTGSFVLFSQEKCQPLETAEDYNCASALQRMTSALTRCSFM